MKSERKIPTLHRSVVPTAAMTLIFNDNSE